MNDGLFSDLYDLLRAFDHRPGLRVLDDGAGHQRAWLSGAGIGALGHSIDHAARLYVEAGASLASDPSLRAALQRIDGSGRFERV